MHVWTHHRWRFPLPPRHKFPIAKYALLRERVVADGLGAAREVHEAEPVPWAWLARRARRRAARRASATAC